MSETVEIKELRAIVDALEEVIIDQENSFAEMHEELARRDRDIHEVHERLRGVYESRTWEYACKIADAYHRFFPENKKRTQILKKAYRRIRGLPPGLKSGSGKPHILSFENFEDPTVSIIIPVHNKYAYTFECLKSISTIRDNVSYEIIIADDASKDLTRHIDRKIKGVKVVRNNEPLLFLKNCNNAAKHANGKYIVFLNNDTIVHDDWLESMLDLMYSNEKIGVVGSKLLFEDGTLQEAGGIVWNDAGGCNFGRGGDPEAPEFNYVKEVDYVSGCSLMIRKNVWDETGGFDERFAPAYYEDTDLAFEVRKRGYKVVYQPRSKVSHYEGISNGKELSEGIKAYQLINQEHFYEKWKDTLVSDHYPSCTHMLRARDRTKGKKIMMLFDQFVPEFDRDAGSRSMHEYIKLFQSMNFHVILAPDNFIRTERYAEVYQQMGVEVLYGEWNIEKWRQWLTDNSEELDLFFLSRPQIAAKYIDFCRQATNATILYCGQDLNFLREQRQYEITKEPRLLGSAIRLKKLELELIGKADCSLFPSIEEKKYLEKINPDFRVEVYPVYIIHEILKRPYAISGRDGLMFLGGYAHKPNVDAVFWFAEEILPFIARRMPDIVMHVYGSKMPDEMKRLDGPNIKIHGFVSDEELQKVYESARMTVIPLRFGAGIKGKVVEALQFGLPVVTTSIGAEGFMEADDYMQIADKAEAIADLICDLYGNEAKMKDMVDRGYRYIEKEYSVEKAQRVIESALAKRSKEIKRCI